MPDAAELAAAYGQMEDERYIHETSSRRGAAALGVRLLRRYAGKQRGRLLDVGCATGIFLDEARKDGWLVEGIEPSGHMRAHALSAVASRIRPGVFADVEPDVPRDVVSFWDVLEHVEDPRETLEHAAGLLRPGGLLVVNVPNRESIPARLMGDRWPLRLPEHLYYFTPGSLKTLLGAAGIEPLGEHLHPVFFRTKYVLHRLAQHLPAKEFFGKVARSPLGEIPVPLLMGEVTMFGRKRG